MFCPSIFRVFSLEPQARQPRQCATDDDELVPWRSRGKIGANDVRGLKMFQTWSNMFKRLNIR
jgi:hypothetical protein